MPGWSRPRAGPPAGTACTTPRRWPAWTWFWTLRELGLGLEVIRAVLSRTTTVAQVAEAHVAVLDEQIRLLRLRRAVLSTVATRGTTIEETLLMHKLARLSAQERQRMIDDFVDGVFAGVDPQAPGAGIAGRMRQLPAELPDDPTPEQVDAWVELAELIADPQFRQRARTMAEAGQQAGPQTGSQAGRPLAARTTRPSWNTRARLWPTGSRRAHPRASPC